MVKFNMYGRGLGLRMAILFTCQFAFIFFGYDQGVFSGIVGNEDFLKVMGHPSPGILGIIVSIYNLGCFSGTIVAFLASDKLGPRKSMWFAMIWIIVGATLQTASYSRAQMLVARYVTGIGTGIETTVVPVYQSELVEARKRGKYVCSEALFVGVGIVIAYWFDYGMSYVDGAVSWRLPVACQMIFAITVIFLVFGLPESPRWLYRQGRQDEALQTLCDVYDRTPDDQKVVDESEGILEAIELETQHGEYQWSQIFKKDEVQTGKRVLLAYGIQFMNQMGGINLVVYYVTSVLEYNVGLGRKLSLLLGGVIQVMFVIGSLYPTFFSDRFGRRKPMMWGSFGLFICMMMISILLSFQGTPQQKPTASACVAFFFLFMLIFGASVNCIPWVYGPEILPLHVRAKGQAIGVSSNWLWNFFVVMITPTLIENLAWKGYLIFMCLNLSFVPIIYFFYPETANLTLEEIDYLFTDRRQGSVHPRVPTPDEVHEVGGEKSE
ncbi:hypothetical protein ASPWEDRAFT_25241 [Aspergillus wentii DTO 134E9]|uniref:Major facilitator superfamily (MFS) profile domain-containing protein n=1 Tax=Aspergillus wentii DTO 134E9 TaxID=1073089 RepID=A0A1L9RWV6_ASPWE|nr:uncharacterized protein ASPWEDRAFT_25241 [Aspergillus wentii DTO 134E9]OJJ39405.1 hypothetical protein ASPWEDRAFT_25241 [Aspergillus wentii DTO 134E9]